MKKILVALAAMAFATTASATIAGSWHDMTANGYAGTKSACQYCHAPHLWVASNVGAAATDAPLWNRNVANPTGYTAYTTIGLSRTAQPGARSLTCLSCHDGQTSVGAVNNGVSEALGTVAARVNVGTDLTNDHPVGLTYSGARNFTTEYNPTPAAPVILSAGGTIECASCHEPHATNASFFLRASASSLCGSCHTK